MGLKILIVADQYYPPTLGGSAISWRRLAHGLAERGHHVTVMAPSTSLRHSVQRDGETVVIRCRSLPAVHLATKASKTSAPRIPLLPEGIIERAIMRLMPDVVHIQTPAIISQTAHKHAKRLGIPVVGTNHGIPDNLLPIKLSKESLPYKIFESRYWEEVIKLLNTCDFVTAPTNLACDMLRENGLVQQAVPVSNGVDLHVFCPPAGNDEKRRLQERFKIPTDRPVVLYAGRLAIEKRLDVLVEAIPKVLSRTPAHFVFMGAGSLNVREMVERLGVAHATTFTGLVDDMALPLVYRAADMLVLPSEAELQGMVLLEAAASGLPLVGANALAIPEIIHHGENGFLHVPGSADDLAERLEILVSDEGLRRQMGARSLELVQHHSLSSSVGHMESIYRDVLSGVTV